LLRHRRATDRSLHVFRHEQGPYEKQEQDFEGSPSRLGPEVDGVFLLQYFPG
jgi:hypothetical protein